MNGKLFFLRRTPKEIEIFGGEVFIDIDGKNIGIIGTEDFEIDLPEGKHTIKMYKSHSFDTFIGVAESVIDLKSGEKLLVKYSSPMLVNQVGNIIVTNFISEQQVDSLAMKREMQIVKDDQILKDKKREQETQTRNGWIIFAVVMFVGMLIWFLVEISSINNF